MKLKVLDYDIIGAFRAGINIHPMKDMERLYLGGYSKAIPQSLGDCWFFIYEEWPDVELPSYISKRELDSSLIPGLT